MFHIGCPSHSCSPSHGWGYIARDSSTQCQPLLHTPSIPFPIFHPRIRLPSRHRPHSPSITYTIIPFLNSNSTIHSFFLRYSIHHSPLSYLHSILHLSLFPFPFFLSKPILIALHLSLTLFQSILRLSLFPFPFFLSIPILIAMHLPPTLPISSPSFTHAFPHVFPSSSLNRHSLSPTHNLPQKSATMRVRGLHTYIEEY